MPENVFKIDFAPYDWLFPRMGMIFHHGGSGTTAYGLHSGVPSCVLPLVFDQFYWGGRIAQLGVGPRPIPYKKLTIERLQDAIQAGFNDTRMQQNAIGLGNKIKAEDGVQNTLRILKAI